ncbi:MAG: phosphoenolpyruvate--protein phosphotransferase [Fibrobacter sp.]|nr:phosphoenolpyruvate--protein phosphotransferase [Fibrobacter sp.]
MTKSKNHNYNPRIELSGISLAPGIAIGKSFRFKQIDLESLRNNTFPVENLNVELNRLQNSVQKSKEQLYSLQKAGVESGKKDIADIFNAHILLLSDESFLQSIRDTVKNERLNVEHILSIKISDIEQSFSNIENETVKTRLLDIQDVYQRLLRNLLEIEHVRVRPLIRKGNPILIAEHLLPSDIALLEFRKIAGVIIEEASAVSHVAIITRSFGIPAVINIPGITSLVHSESTLIIDGFEGKVIINPSSSEITSYRKKRNHFDNKIRTFKYRYICLTRDGVRVHIEANANTPGEVREAVAQGAEGVGLLRTEIYYMSLDKKPSVEEEVSFYKKIHESAEGHPVTIRLLDLGADKTLSYLQFSQEDNPQLGTRGIRYLLNNSKLLHDHLRSILMSSKFGVVKVLIPFISIVQELDFIISMINDIRIHERLDPSRIKLGIMVEIPSVLWALPLFIEKLDFLSVGTNDLIQFAFAADRENRNLDEYRRASLPILLKMVKQLVQTANAHAKEITICGESASDPATALLLIGTGIRSLSTRVNAIEPVRKEIENKTIDQANFAVHEYLRLFK